MNCQAITKPAHAAHFRLPPHVCRNAVVADGWCRIHHPTRCLERLNRRRATLEKSLEKVRAEIHAVEEQGASAHDIPGQLKIFA